MALVGKLEDIPPAEILIFLSDSGKTGKLNFTTGTQEGMIVFRDGKIIYAASSSIRETFGSIALTLQILNHEQLDYALLLQHRSREDKRLGEILVESGAMTEIDVQKILEHQVGQVVHEIFEWRTGYFKFRNLEIKEFGDVEVDARDFVAGAPLDTRSVALDAARVLDEASLAPKVTASDGEEAAEQTTMAQIRDDVPAPALTAETVKEIFDVAETVFSRGVVLAVHENGTRGLAHFGLVETVVPPSQRVRELRLPADENSVISHVVRDRRIFRGEPDHVAGNSKFVQMLGLEWPEDGVAIPMMIGERVALVFWGDNQPRGLPAGSTAALEETLASVGRRLAEAVQK